MEEEDLQTQYLDDALIKTEKVQKKEFPNTRASESFEERLMTNSPQLLSSEIELPDAAQFSNSLNLPYGMF